jgi:hypothetical protein
MTSTPQGIREQFWKPKGFHFLRSLHREEGIRLMTSPGVAARLAASTALLFGFISHDLVFIDQ